MLWPQNSQSVKKAFAADIENLHLLYDYDVHNAETGQDEKWRYEMWFHSEDRIVYAIHGGPMAGRLNYQKADYQCIRPGELWQCNWLEGTYFALFLPDLRLHGTDIHSTETGTICSLVYDIPNKKITTLIGFSKGHWTKAEDAHGDKRNPDDFARWRKLAEIGKQTDRHLLSEQANILETFHGAGDLKDIDLNAPTL